MTTPILGMIFTMAEMLENPARRRRAYRPMHASSLSQGSSRNPVGQAHHLHAYWSGADERNMPETAPAGKLLSICSVSSKPVRSDGLVRRHQTGLVEPAFAWSDLARGLNPYPPHYRAAFASLPRPDPPSHRHPLTAGLPRREDDGLTTFHGRIKDGLGSDLVASALDNDGSAGRGSLACGWPRDAFGYAA